jgi:hydroxymethylpyrimidine pyrophosphatase-like HAD family hydrolase
MKFGALALDYDGTIAVDGQMSPAVRQAIGEARQAGVVVLLVTGRRMVDLARAAGDLTCFDVVVAENGAVLQFPASGRHELLAHPPDPGVVDELRRRQVPFSSGEAVIEADAGSAHAILDVIRKLEQPLVLAFNRGSLMVLPQAVSKSTGLRKALFALRLSPHNAVGIGDAENDHDLLDTCEVGVAVGWGSAALRAIADEVIEGTGPDAVAGYIRRLLRQPRLSAAQMGRRRLLLGNEPDGTPVSLAVRGRTILIAGEPATGKSWLAGLLCEQLILQGYCLCIIDPEGDYETLEALPRVVTIGGNVDGPPPTREVVEALRHPDVSVIVDLSKISHQEKREYLRTLMPLLAGLRRRTGLPHKILVDEAHYFLSGADSRSVDPDLAGYLLVTYRVSGLAPSIFRAGDAVVIVTREADPVEAETLRSLAGTSSAGDVVTDVFEDLDTDEAALLPGAEEAQGRIRRFRVAPRLTAHVRHRAKYLEMPVDERQAFVFAVDGRPGPRVRTLKAFAGFLVALPSSDVEDHLLRHDFSRWIGEVFTDRALAARLHAIEARTKTDQPQAIAEAIAQAIRSRYDTAD